MFSTSEDVRYIAGCSVTMGSVVYQGDTMSTSGDVQYIRGISWIHRGGGGGYHKYTGRFSVHRKDVISTSLMGYHDSFGGIS